ncbi:MAG: hypothetical protein H7Y38_13965 [Armatimonadetes bacterium]|nr:hypothetical protein [Armatimonadota bacterium]
MPAASAPKTKVATRFRFLDAAPALPASARTGARLPPKVVYSDTIKRSEAELSELNAQNVWVESGHDADDLRLDGHLQTNAKSPRFAAIVVRLYASVAVGGKPLGALKIVSGTYSEWQGNLWAAAQTLEKLRTLAALGTVDARELYALFADTSAEASAPTEKETPSPKRPATGKPRPRPVPTTTAPPAWDAAKQDAARLLLREAGEDDHFRFAVLLLKNARTARRVFIAATKNAHPDGGGTDERMRDVQGAWQALGA